MWRWVGLIWMLGGGLDQVPAPRVLVTDSRAHHSVVQAVQGAQRRLERPDCQRLFTDFQDTEGHPLVEGLKASTFSPADYLVRQILFVAADDATQCRRDEVVTMFTAPGFKVVHVCGARFARRFERDPVVSEILVIHEMLHTLGLGESPPSSAAITAQVTKRCGGS